MGTRGISPCAGDTNDLISLMSLYPYLFETKASSGVPIRAGVLPALHHQLKSLVLRQLFIKDKCKQEGVHTRSADSECRIGGNCFARKKIKYELRRRNEGYLPLNWDVGSTEL